MPLLMTSVVDKLSRPAWRDSRWLWIIAGSLSGALSHLTQELSPSWLQLTLMARNTSASPVPGLVFGSVIALCLHLYGVRSKLAFLVVIALTTLGWIAAVDVATLTEERLRHYHLTVVAEDTGFESEPARDDGGEKELAVVNQAFPYSVEVAGAVGGCVGGLSVILAAALASGRFRRVESWALTLLAAMLAGALLQFGFRGWWQLTLFFAIWQAAVLSCVSYGLSQSVGLRRDTVEPSAPVS